MKGQPSSSLSISFRREIALFITASILVTFETGFRSRLVINRNLQPDSEIYTPNNKFHCNSMQHAHDLNLCHFGLQCNSGQKSKPNLSNTNFSVMSHLGDCFQASCGVIHK